MVFEIKQGVKWVGKIDGGIRKFHGDELSTHHGTSFNAYLIEDEKCALIDSVWTPFTDEFIQNLSNEIDISKIDYVIALHGEPDHSGALPAIMELIPEAKVICSANGMKSIKGYYHKDWNFVPMKTGDKLSLGKRELIFMEAPMLHWPDTLTCFLTEDNILFSSDIFGQHFADERMYSDLVDRDVFLFETMKYYTCIVQPFSGKVHKKIEEIRSLNFPIDLICPAHGVIWRNNINEAIDLYDKWSNGFRENQITVIYDTMYNSTQRMADSIVEGIRLSDSDVTVKVYNASSGDKSDMLTEVFRSKAICIGSPNLNGGLLTSVSAFLEEVHTLGTSGKKAAVFGSYGWSGTNLKLLSEKLTSAGFEVIGEGTKAQWNPDESALRDCVELGKKLAMGS
jgi:flavorubredoxin